jgi:hypothetical protein
MSISVKPAPAGAGQQTLGDASTSGPPGSILSLDGGTYALSGTDQWSVKANSATKSGTPGNPIVVQAADPQDPPILARSSHVLTGPDDGMRFAKHVHFKHLHWINDSTEYAVAAQKNGPGDSVEDIRYENCFFHSKSYELGPQGVTGNIPNLIRFDSMKRAIFLRCRFGVGTGGEAGLSNAIEIVRCEDVWFVDCDFISARGGHTAISFADSYRCGILRMFGGNLWHRTLNVHGGEEGLVEGNVIIARHWDFQKNNIAIGNPAQKPTNTYREADGLRQDPANQGGKEEVRHFNEKRTLYVDNLIAGTHGTTEESGYGSPGGQFAALNSAASTLEQCGFVHNVLHGVRPPVPPNPNSGESGAGIFGNFSYQFNGTDLNYRGNEILNNILSKPAHVKFQEYQGADISLSGKVITATGKFAGWFDGMDKFKNFGVKISGSPNPTNNGFKQLSTQTDPTSSTITTLENFVTESGTNLKVEFGCFSMNIHLGSDGMEQAYLRAGNRCQGNIFADPEKEEVMRDASQPQDERNLTLADLEAAALLPGNEADSWPSDARKNYHVARPEFVAVDDRLIDDVVNEEVWADNVQDPGDDDIWNFPDGPTSTPLGDQDHSAAKYRDQYSLKSTATIGRGVAVPLATVTSPQGTYTEIDVSNAMMFWPEDGSSFDEVPGHKISIGGQVRTVQERSFASSSSSAGTLKLDGSVVVAGGDPIYRAEAAAARHVGLLTVPAAIPAKLGNLGAGVHPRVWIAPEQIADLQTKAQGSHASDWGQVVQAAEAVLGDDPETFHRAAPERLGALAASRLIGGPSAQATDHANKAIVVALHLGSHAPVSDLGGLWDIVSMALVYDWLYGTMNASQRSAIRAGLDSRMAARAGEISDNRRIGSGMAPEVAMAVAIGASAMCADGNDEENARWAGWFATANSYLDDGTEDSYFGALRHFDSGGVGGTPYGSSSLESDRLEWMVRYAQMMATAPVVDVFSQPFFGGHIHWMLWHWVGLRRFFRQHDSTRTTGYQPGEQIYATLIAGRDDSNVGRMALWLAEEIQSFGVGSMSGGLNIWNLFYRPTNKQPLRPTTTLMGSAVKLFPDVAKLVVREGWLGGSTAVAVSAPKYHVGGGQWRDAGSFELYTSLRRLAGHGGWAAGDVKTYKAGDDASGFDTGAQHTYSHRIIARPAISVYDDQAHTARPQDIVFSTHREVSGSGFLDDGVTSEHFQGAVSDGTYRYSNAGGQLRPKPADYLTRANPTGFLPRDVTDLITDPAWLRVAQPLVRAVTETAQLVHFALDLTGWYPLVHNTGYMPATHHIRRHFYFVLPGAVPGWDEMIFFTFDEVSAPDSSEGKLTKRSWTVLPAAPTDEGTGAGELPRMAVRDVAAAAAQAKAFVDVFLPVDAERVIRTGPVDLEGVEYAQPDIDTQADDWHNAPVARLEINPPGTAEAVEFLTAYYPCSADTADAPPATLINDANNVGLRIGYTGTEKDFLIPRDGSAPVNPSNEIDTTPPAAPTGLTATAATGRVLLDWDANSESDLHKYKVQRRTR